VGYVSIKACIVRDMSAPEQTHTSREDKIKLMVDLISTVYSLCRHASLQNSTHEECKKFMRDMELIYEKVLRTNRSGYTSLNYSLSERITTEVQDSLKKSYGIFLECRRFVRPSIESAVVFLNTVMSRLDDEKEWHVALRAGGRWWMQGRDGEMQQITVENPMLEVAYTSVDEKYSFVTSCVKKMERMCQYQYELIAEGDAFPYSQFKRFRNSVREIEENPRRLVELCEQTCDNWSPIEPDVTEIEDWATVPYNICNLIDIGIAVRFLWCLAGDLREKYPFVWIVSFKVKDLYIRKEYVSDENQTRHGKHRPHEFCERMTEKDHCGCMREPGAREEIAAVAENPEISNDMTLTGTQKVDMDSLLQRMQRLTDE
jgi:hypothetical protein